MATTEKVYSTYANGVRVVRYRPERWAEYRSYSIELFNEQGVWERAYNCPWDFLANARKAAQVLSLGRATL